MFNMIFHLNNLNIMVNLFYYSFFAYIELSVLGFSNWSTPTGSTKSSPKALGIVSTSAKN